MWDHCVKKLKQKVCRIISKSISAEMPKIPSFSLLLNPAQPVVCSKITPKEFWKTVANGIFKRGVKSKVLRLLYNLLRYFDMNVWQKLILLVVMLACFLEEVMAAPKKAAKAPAKPAPKPQKGGKKGKKQ